jgi:hypothetical protein
MDHGDDSVGHMLNLSLGRRAAHYTSPATLGDKFA